MAGSGEPWLFLDSTWERDAEVGDIVHTGLGKREVVTGKGTQGFFGGDEGDWPYFVTQNAD
jgi:hypothetical protein